MKKLSSYFLHILIITLWASTSFAQFDVPHIIVYGSAETEAVPDRLTWSLLVKSNGSEVSIVADAHAIEVGAVLKYLRTAGVAEEKIKTSHIQLKENWVYRDKTRLQEGYVGTTSIHFETTGTTDFLSHWKNLTSLKNLTIQGVMFDISERTAIQDSTQLKATLAAKKKAMSIAKVLNTTVVEALLIEEIGGYSPAPRNRVAAMAESSKTNNTTPISPGTQIIRSKVKAVFRISTNKTW